MHPFVRIMQRYIEDYCNRHDPSVCLEIMAPGYVVHIGGRHLIGRDERYVPAAAAAFADFPDLRLTVHELHTNGARLVMRFSERGHHRVTGHLACWGGIGLYDWDGERLVENWVEQDYESRRRQVHGFSGPDDLDAAHPDPWGTEPVAEDAEVLAVGRAFLEQGDLLAAPEVVVDESWLHGPARIPVTPVEVRVDDVFGVGDRVAGHVCLVEVGGGFLDLGVILRVRDGEVRSVRAVSDRVALPERR